MPSENLGSDIMKIYSMFEDENVFVMDLNISAGRTFPKVRVLILELIHVCCLRMTNVNLLTIITILEAHLTCLMMRLYMRVFYYLNWFSKL